jgi:hypothetical protein
MTTRRTSGQPTSEADLKPQPPRSTPRNNTLRRCWGALKETVDALGAAWDVYDNDAEYPSANPPRHSEARPPSTPTPPKRPSLDIFKTPPSRPLQESSQSHRSHYATLTHSPTTSRSSRRKRKTNPRHSTLTPTRRRNQKGDIDHSYSTDEDGCGPHARLLDRIFYQGPPQVLDDAVCVFACPQGELMVNTKPNDHHGRKEVTSEQPRNLSSSCATRASIDERMSVIPDKVDKTSLEQVCSDRSPSEASHLDEKDPKTTSPHSAHVTWEIKPRNHEYEMNRSDSRDTRAQNEGRTPTDPFSTTIAAPLRQLTERAVSKMPEAKYDMDAWSRDVARLGEIPSTGVLDGTMPTTCTSGVQSEYADSREDAIVQDQEVIDEWRGQVVPQEGFPNEALLDGRKLHMPHFETRKRRLQRRAASCVILSAEVPPERDTTDLLTTPLGPWWGTPTDDHELSGMAASGSEETLMSTFGISSDSRTADSHPGPILTSANDVMIRSAAMGSMSKLECTDAVVRRSAEAASRERLAYADDRNLWWHCVNNARDTPGSLCWTVMLDMCELPPDFQEDDDPRAPVNRCKSLHRAVYDFYSMCHGEGSDLNTPQRNLVHGYYMRKVEEHTKSVWESFMSRWVPNIKHFPPANPFTAAAEAYTQVAIKDHPRSGSMFRRKESPVNALSKYVTCMPKHAWRQKEDRMRFVLDNGLRCFAQLVFVRCQVMRFEIYLVKHPEVSVPAQLP